MLSALLRAGATRSSASSSASEAAPARRPAATSASRSRSPSRRSSTEPSARSPSTPSPSASTAAATAPSPGRRSAPARRCDGSGAAARGRADRLRPGDARLALPDLRRRRQARRDALRRVRWQGSPRSATAPSRWTCRAGIESGQRIRIGGAGHAGETGAAPGDLYVEVTVADDDRFERHGRAPRLGRARCAATRAMLGGEVVVPTLDGEREIEVPAGAQPGERVVLDGLGLPSLRGTGRGDQHVLLEVVVPGRLSDDQRELAEQPRRDPLRGEPRRLERRRPAVGTACASARAALDPARRPLLARRPPSACSRSCSSSLPAESRRSGGAGWVEYAIYGVAGRASRARRDRGGRGR